MSKFLSANLRYRMKGQYNAICDKCGMRFAGEQLQEEWTGLLVCQWCLDQKHFLDDTSDYMVVEDYSVENARYEPVASSVFDQCAISGHQAKSGFAVAGCAVAGQLTR